MGIWKKEETYDQILKSTLLSPKDLQNLNDTKLDKRKFEKLLTRKLIQELLPDFGEVKYHGLTKLSSGKPLLIHNPLELSVSHCEEYIAVQLTTSPLAGIDIQNINPKLRTVGPRVFSTAEMSQIEGNDILLARAWSAKEAIFKYYEKGEINFIRDIKLHHIDNPTIMYGELIRGTEIVHINLNCITELENYQIVYCDE